MALDRIPVRLRLSLGHAVFMAIIYVCIGFCFSNVLAGNLNDSVNAALISSARSIRDARFTWGLGYPRDALVEQFFRDPLHLNQFMGERFIRPYAQVISIAGKVQSKTDNVVVSLPVTPKAIARAEKGFSTFETFGFKDRDPLRQVTLPVMLEGEFTGEIVQVGASLRPTLETLHGIALILWVVLPSTLFISILFGYIVTARALKPVKVISRAAAKMGIDDLSIRLPIPPAADELQELSHTFNAMLDRREDAVKRLRRFTGDVSHELRTPLAVLRGEAELALRRPRQADEYRSSLERVVREASGMTTIIEDLLLLARAESKSVAMNWLPIKTKDFVADLAEQVSAIYAARSVELRTAVCGLSTFSCARGYLSLALKNILFNAAKHSAAGASVIFEVRQEGREVVFTISDEGEGIPEESLPNIFDPFFRADTARNRSSGGVGIGLSLALALVKLHEGQIKVSSRVGEGTTFTARIPLRQEAPQGNGPGVMVSANNNSYGGQLPLSEGRS